MRVSPKETPQTKLAVAFATTVASGDYAGAHRFLSSTFGSAMTAAKLEHAYKEMIAYGSGAPTTIAAVTAMDTWPDKKPGDVEWVYVAMANDTYSEAVTVVVAHEGETLVIRSIEWGRP